MITVEVDQEKLKELYLQKIDGHLQELESEVFVAIHVMKSLYTYYTHSIEGSLMYKGLDTIKKVLLGRRQENVGKIRSEKRP